MLKTSLDEKQIRERLENMYRQPKEWGLEAYVVTKVSPKLKRMSLSEEKNVDNKNFRTMLREMFFEIVAEQFLAEEVKYDDANNMANNQHKNLIIEQSNAFQPFVYLNDSDEIAEFVTEDLTDATGLVFRFRKDRESIWIYQHLWSIMVPNKKKTGLMARLMQFENRIVFSEQKENLLTISKKIDILIMDNYLITNNVKLLQKNFGFQAYIEQSAKQTVQNIIKKDIAENTGKLSEYISRGKTQYARKMMRISSSKVFELTQEEIINKVNTLPRWNGKFKINTETNQIILNTYAEVENLIDLFDERYTRSEVTGTEYDTEVKMVATEEGKRN